MEEGIGGELHQDPRDADTIVSLMFYLVLIELAYKKFFLKVETILYF